MGPIKQVVTGDSAIQRRYLAIFPIQNGDRLTPVQVQLGLEAK
ncbi:hypothetical protein AB0758_48795 [Tolypothrix bouteillei VB521301_2]